MTSFNTKEEDLYINKVDGIIIINTIKDVKMADVIL